MRTYTILVLTVSVAIGCGSEAVEKNPDAASLPTDSGSANIFNPVDASDSDAGGDADNDSRPQVFEISANPPTISRDEFAVVSALVGDPQGVDDIIAVRLLDSDAETILSAMENTNGGSYETQVSWDDLNDSTPISFDSPAGERTLFVEVVDSLNQRTQAELVLGLSCPNAVSACRGFCGLEECNGECLSPGEYSTTQNCGACGNACQPGQRCDGNSCVDFEGNFGDSCTRDTIEADCIGQMPECFGSFGSEPGYCTYQCDQAAQCPAGFACVEPDYCIFKCETVADCPSDVDRQVCLAGMDIEGNPVMACGLGG